MDEPRSDVLGAANRLRHHFHEDEPSPLLLPEDDDGIRDDVILLAAEHPADDSEPVTEEWLRQVGFYDNNPDGTPGLQMRNREGFAVAYYSGKGMYAMLGFHLASNTIWLPTRGHVRLLLAALGIPPDPRS